MARKRQREPWHTMTVEAVEKRLKTSCKNGLEPKICRNRLERYGRNELFIPEPMNTRKCAKVIFSDTSLLILALILLIALCFGRFSVALTLLVILLVNCAVVIWAYARANHIKESMSSYSAPRVKVIRGGRILWSEAASLVPGDILILTEGDIVPCDARLAINSRDFEVLTCTLDEKGKESYAETPKDAGHVYENASDARSLNPVNMVYTGSVIHKGRAKAIVTETGTDTCLGSWFGPHPFVRHAEEPRYIAQLEGYMSRYSLFMCALILPLTLIGIFAGGGELDILNVLLLTLALVVSSMSEQLLTMGRIICACGMIRASLASGEENAAIIKKYSVLEKLCRVDELFLFGQTALSDGNLHPFAVYTANRMFHGENLKDPSVAHLAEIAYWYDKGMRSGGVSASELFGLPWRNGLRELMQSIEFDTESSDIRAISLKPVPEHNNCVEATVRSVRRGEEGARSRAQSTFYISRYEDASVLTSCGYRVQNATALPLTETDRKMLTDLFCQLRDQGTEVVIYVTSYNGKNIFEGMIAYREAVDPALTELRQRLSDSHVRSSLFLQEESAKQISFLIYSGWIESEADVVLASKLARQGRKLTDVFEEKRVFIGFSEEEILACFRLCLADGKTPASLGLRHGEAPMMNLSAVCFTCETRTYTSNAPEEDRFDTVESERYLMAQCDQTVRRNSDVLIRRATKEGGGLAGVLNAIGTARSVLFRMMIALQYLLVVQFLRMTLVVIPLLFGKILLSPALILISGIWIDLGYIMVCAFHHCGEEVLLTPNDYKNFFSRPISSRPDWVCASVFSGLLTLLIALILDLTGAATAGNGLELFVFLSLIASQTCLLLCLLRTSGSFSGKFRARASSTLVFSVTFLLTVMIAFIPPLATLLGCPGVRWLPFLLSLLAPLWLIGFYFLSCRFRLPFLRAVKRLAGKIVAKIRNKFFPRA